MSINFYQSLSIPLEAWCASPKGCYKSTDPASGEVTTNNGISPAPALADKASESNPLQDAINNSIDYFVNASMGKLLEILLYIVVAIVVLIVIKKLMVAGVAKARSLDINSKISDAGKSYAAEKKKLHDQQVKAIAEAKKLRRGVAEAIANDQDYGHAFNALEEVLENGKSFYEQEIAKQDSIQSASEQSLADNLTQQIASVDMGAPDLTLKSLRTYDTATKSMFTTKPVDQLFAEYNNLDEAMDLSYGTDYSDPSSGHEKQLKTARRIIAEGLSALTDDNGEALPMPPGLPHRKIK